MKISITKLEDPKRKSPFEVIWFPRDTETGRVKRVREYFPTKKAAEQRAVKIRNIRTEADAALDAMTPLQREELKLALAIATRRKVSILDAVKAWDSGHGAAGEPVAENITHLLRYAEAKSTDALTVEHAAKLFLASRTDRGKRAATVRSYGNFLTAFQKQYPADAWQKLSHTKFDAWVRGKWTETSAVTAATHLRAFLRWSESKHFLHNKPLASYKYERTTRDKKITFLTIEEAQGLLDAADGESMPIIALGLFAGIRPFEIARMDWSCVKFAERRIRITEDVSKTRKARIIEDIPDALWEALSLADVPTSGPVAPALKRIKKTARTTEEQAEHSVRAAINAARDRAKKAGTLKRWVNDIIRHSFITYLCASTAKPGFVSRVSGTGLSMIDRHYDGVATRETGEAYFKIRRNPAAVQRQ